MIPTGSEVFVNVLNKSILKKLRETKNPVIQMA
jgi:hypothetical protein